MPEYLAFLRGHFRTAPEECDSMAQSHFAKPRVKDCIE
jgi:hypothetical protein